jgi:hypothetical protein
MHCSRSKIPRKKSRPYIYDVKFLSLLGAPYIYTSRLRVNVSFESSTRTSEYSYCKLNIHILPSNASHVLMLNLQQQVCHNKLQAGSTRVRFPMVSLEFFIDKTYRHHYGPGVDSASNRIEYQEYFLEGGRYSGGAYGWQPYHIHVPTVTKSGSLNLLETSGPVQAWTSIALPLPLPLLMSARTNKNWLLKYT